MPRPTESFLNVPAKSCGAILASHGSPCDREPQEAVMQALEQAQVSGPVLPVPAQAPALPALIANSLWRPAIERHAA